MRNMLMLVVLLFCSTNIAAQTLVKGKVIDNDNQPIFGVNIVTKGTNKGTVSKEDGTFELRNVPQNAILVFSYVGFKTREIKASSDLNVILYEGNEVLQEVIVSTRKNNFSRKKTAYVSKLPLRDLENAHVYSTITTELLESQVITNLDDALTNATGISKLWEATGRDPLKGTGFFSTRGFSTQSQMVNGLPGVTLSAVDPSYIERIEVIKGPAATLFGSTFTSLGGLINVVTKKPYEGKGGSLSYTGGSFGTHRFSADVNTPLNDKNNMFFRMNMSFLTQESFQDAGFRRTFFAAPSLTYRVNNRLNLSAGLEYSWTRQTNSSMLFLRRGMPLVAKNIEELNIDPNKSFTSDDIYLTSPNLTTRAIADYKISDQWTSQTVFAGNFGESYGYYQYNSDGGAAAILPLAQLLTQPSLAPLNPIFQPLVGPLVTEANTLLQQEAFTRIYDKRDATANHINLQQNFTGDFKIAGMRNRMVVGLDYVRSRFDYKNKSGNPVITSTSNFPQILGFLNNPVLPPPFPALDAQSVALLQQTGAQLTSFYNNLPYFDAFFDAQGNVIPTSFTPNANTYTTRGDLDRVFDQVPANKREFGSETLAAYVSNVLNVTDKLIVNLGLRLDHFIQDGNLSDDTDDYTKTNFSPSAGILYQPIKNKLSVFANYQTGFINRPPRQVRDQVTNEVRIEQVDPQKARQFEAGAKTNFFNGKLNVGASFYHITVKDRPSSNPRVPIVSVPITLGEVVSKGIELEINASPISGLNLRASYAYNDSKITETDIVELQDRRPEEAGPASVYNLWADYRFLQGSFLEKFGIGAGFNGASAHNTIDNGVSGQFELPSYTIFNASMYYDADKFRIGVKVNNLTDKQYYKGWSTVNPQAPRAFLGTITYKF